LGTVILGSLDSGPLVGVVTAGVVEVLVVEVGLKVSVWEAEGGSRRFAVSLLFDPPPHPAITPAQSSEATTRYRECIAERL
jgi:hypothetical protein